MYATTGPIRAQRPGLFTRDTGLRVRAVFLAKDRPRGIPRGAAG